MKKRTVVIVLLILGFLSVGYFAKGYFYPSHKGQINITNTGQNDEFRNGDIIFQESLSNQCKAIKKATKSRYSHCGIIYKQGKEYYVFEAVQPVTVTPLEEWVSRGKNNHYVVKRLKNADSVLTSENIEKMKNIGETFYGKNYDLTFEWSDDKIYCSELVWKIYKRALNIEVGKLQKLREFDLSHEIVRKKVEERYGDDIPWDETVISPISIFKSELLETVKAN